jgi:hypothetical protein
VAKNNKNNKVVSSIRMLRKLKIMSVVRLRCQCLTSNWKLKKMLKMPPMTLKMTLKMLLRKGLKVVSKISRSLVSSKLLSLSPRVCSEVPLRKSNST